MYVGFYRSCYCMMELSSACVYGREERELKGLQGACDKLIRFT